MTMPWGRGVGLTKSRPCFTTAGNAEMQARCRGGGQGGGPGRRAGAVRTQGAGGQDAAATTVPHSRAPVQGDQTGTRQGPCMQGLTVVTIGALQHAGIMPPG